MGFKMKQPHETAEQKAGREAARTQQVSEIQSNLGDENLNIFKLFGRRSMLGGSGGGGAMSGSGARGMTY
jgi:hypothetical protein